MKIYYLTVISKDRKSLKRYLNLLTKSSKLLKLNLTNRNNSGKHKIKRVSVLKSPHVNKTAQEQFEFELFSSKLIVETTQTFKILTLIKKLKSTVLSSVKIKLNSIVKKRKLSPFFRLTLDLKKKSKISKVLTFLDYYGEISLT